MADSFTPNLNLTQPEVGQSRDTWGTKLNSDLSIIDAIFAGAGGGTSVGLNVGAGKTLTMNGLMAGKLTLSADGNFGVGFATPGVRLDVHGPNFPARFNSTNGNAYQIALAQNGNNGGYVGSDGSSILFGRTSGSSVVESGRFDAAGNLCVGTSSSGGARVRVNGATGIYATTSSNTAVRGDADSGYGVYGVSSSNHGAVGQSSTGYGVYGVSSSNHGVFGKANVLDATGLAGYASNSAVYGFVGYMTSASGFWSFYGTASCYVAGNYQGSDARLKENVAPLTDGLSVLRSLPIRVFDWKENTDQRNSGRVHEAGVIAQEVQGVFPAMLKEAVAPKPLPGQTPTLNQQLGSFLTADYGMLIPYLVRAVQQQADMIDALTARVAKLEAK